MQCLASHKLYHLRRPHKLHKPYRNHCHYQSSFTASVHNATRTACIKGSCVCIWTSPELWWHDPAHRMLYGKCDKAIILGLSKVVYSESFPLSSSLPHPPPHSHTHPLQWVPQTPHLEILFTSRSMIWECVNSTTSHFAGFFFAKLLRGHFGDKHSRDSYNVLGQAHT